MTPEIEIEAGSSRLGGTLVAPPGARGLVVFAHGSGSGRHSPRNRMVAERLNDGGLATLLFDLLDEREARDRRNVFDIDLLADRLGAALRRAGEETAIAGLPVGLFGASTGAAAALRAAAVAGSAVSAVVSRGGRPDLAGDSLPSVTAPTLLIVGGEDHEVIELNRRAMSRMRCLAELAIVPGAGHLFENPGELEAVAEQALEWFARHFARSAVHERA